MSGAAATVGSGEAAGPATVRPRAFTLRAVLIGLGLTALFAVITPINDWVIANTYLYCHYLPPGVLLVILGFALVVNPLLGARRLKAGEMVVIVAMLLGLGGTVSNGFTRLWIKMVTGPAKLFPSANTVDPLAPRGEPVRLPQGYFMQVPSDGPIDAGDAEHRLVIDRFYDRLPNPAPRVTVTRDAQGVEHSVVGGPDSNARIDHRSVVTWRDAQGATHHELALSGRVARAAPPGSFLDLDHEPGLSLLSHRVDDVVDTPAGALTVLDVQPAGIPWRPWVAVFIRWLPLLAGAIVACVALAALVREQWIENERLPYPITAFMASLLEEPHAGFRLPPVMRQQAFWYGMLLAAIILGSQLLEMLGFLPVSIPTELDLFEPARTPRLQEMYQWWAIFRPHVYLSIAALTFFLPLDLSFSLWFFFVATNVAYMVLGNNGIRVDRDDAEVAGFGGYLVECGLIAWVGRKHYWSALKAAVGLARGPHRALAPYVWALLLAVVGMGVTLVSAGARFDQALLAVLVFLGMSLVLARMVAEAGIPFVQTPTGWFVSQIVFSFTGFNAPVSQLAPLTLVGIGLMPDSRENLLPYAVEAQYLGHRLGVPRRWLSLSMVTTALGGAAAAVAVMVYIYYRREHPPEDWPLGTLMAHNLEPLARGLDGHGIDPRHTWAAYAIGAAIVGLTGIGRLLFVWWPLHPIGALIVPAFCTFRIWFSFFVGWIWKLAVMRYGGTGIYQRLKPFATGLIAGEAMMSAVCMAIGLVRFLQGKPHIELPRFLPG